MAFRFVVLLIPLLDATQLYKNHISRDVLSLQMPAFSAQDDVSMVFSSILDDEDTRLAIHDLKQSSFSYDVPGERGLAEISGYLHASSQIGYLMEE